MRQPTNKRSRGVAYKTKARLAMRRSWGNGSPEAYVSQTRRVKPYVFAERSVRIRDILHGCTVPSGSAVASSLPSGLNAHLSHAAKRRCRRAAGSLQAGLVSAVFHRRTVPSTLAMVSGWRPPRDHRRHRGAMIRRWPLSATFTRTPRARSSTTRSTALLQVRSGCRMRSNR
jgi:hypothetical protein